jgi:alkylhydroperoxidase family enzyme
MPHIEPLPLDQIDDPELRQQIQDAQANGVPGALFLQIAAHRPEYAKTIAHSLHESHFNGNLDHKLKEIIRIQLARTAEDTYFANLRSTQALNDGLTENDIDAGSADYDDDPRFSEREKIALRFADQLYLDATKVDAAFYDELKQHFTEPEIMELGSFIAFHYGIQMFTRTLHAFPDRDRQGNSISQAQSEKLYGSEVSR